MKRNWIIAAVVFLIGGFLLGFVPQFRRASRFQEELRTSEQRIQQLQREASLAKARELASLTYIELTHKNYGHAAQHATEFFNQIAGIRNDASDQAVKSRFDDILGQKDAMLANIAKMDAAAESSAGNILERMQKLTLR